MEEMLEPIDVLKEIKRAFETNLIGVADRLSIEKRMQVIKLRKRIDKAITDGEIMQRVYSHCTGASYEESR